MDRYIIKVRNKKRGSHVHMTFFIGLEDQALPNVGTLIGTIGDYQIFEAMIGLGAKQTGNQVLFVTEGWSPENAK